MKLSTRLERLLQALGADAYRIPEEILVPAPFGEVTPDLERLVGWLGSRCADHADHTMVGLAEHRFDPLASRVLVETLRALARRDAASAIEYATALSEDGPVEAILHLGALGRVAALVAVGADEADDELLAIGAQLQAARPIARTVALWLGEIGLVAGPLGRRARALLEGALSAAVQAAWELEPPGHLPDPSAAGQPGAAVTGRIVDLVAVLGALAAHREGLTQRLSALASELPPFVAPLYVVAYLAALGAAAPGPYLREVHERLARAAADRSPRVRALAVEALGTGARTNAALAAVLIESLTDADPTVRVAAALAIADAGVVTDEAARELEDLVELGGDEEALAATRALAMTGRPVPDHRIAQLDDPLVRATARVLARPPGGDGRAFAALLETYASASSDETSDADPRLQPQAVLVAALKDMQAAEAARWLRRFVLGEHDDALGQVFWLALDDADRVPGELLEAGEPLLGMLARGEVPRGSLAALVAARLWPDDPRLEAIILEWTEAPVSMLGLAALEHLGEHLGEALLAIAEEPGDDNAALALAALARCDLGAAIAKVVVAALVAHINDEDSLAEAAYGALVELVERGVVSAD